MCGLRNKGVGAFVFLAKKKQKKDGGIQLQGINIVTWLPLYCGDTDNNLNVFLLPHPPFMLITLQKICMSGANLISHHSAINPFETG